MTVLLINKFPVALGILLFCWFSLLPAHSQVQITDPQSGAYLSGSYEVVLTIDASLDVARTRLYLDGVPAFDQPGKQLSLVLDFGESINRHELVAEVLLSNGESRRSAAVLTRELVVNYEATSRLVLITATVRTRRDKPIIGLGAESFRVFEDGSELEIQNFHTEALPLDLVFMLDSSSSLRQEIADLKRYATSFVMGLDPYDRALLYEIKSKPKKLSDFSTDRKKLVDLIDGLLPRGETAFFDALNQGLSEFERRGKGKRALVLFTDGRDSIYEKPETKARLFRGIISQAQKAEITIYTIGLGKKIHRQALQRLARETGGRAYFADKVRSLPEIFQQIITTLKHQYVLSVQPGTAGSGFHRIEVKVKKRGAVVYARKGYSLD